MKTTSWSRGHLKWVAAGFALLLCVGLLAANLMGGEKKIEQRLDRVYSLDDPRFLYELGVLLGPPFVDGNRHQVLLNGDAFFPSMLQAIQSAQHTINFETYIYWSGDIGRQFAQALMDKARAGVKVHVLLDWVGSAKMDETLITSLEQAGVKLVRYHPPHWSNLNKLNNRTHRKLLIVDGRVGFTGGAGIAQQWTGRAQSPEHWRDTHFRVEGPVVAQMQAAFLDNWIKATGAVLQGPDHFPTLQAAGSHKAQMFSSSPSGGSESMQLMYLLGITAATRSIDLQAAYFVPDELSMRALEDALRRGVRLRIIVPGEHIDSETVRKASRARWGSLLQAGALIAEYQPTMFHCKMLILDGLLVSVGSTNFDNRSFRLNDEATLNIHDAGFAAEQTAIFEADLARARPISHAEWLNRPWHEKLMEELASLLDSQL